MIDCTERRLAEVRRGPHREGQESMTKGGSA
jgi:hypothetical protein